MNAHVSDQRKLPSGHVPKGLARVPCDAIADSIEAAIRSHRDHTELFKQPERWKAHATDDGSGAIWKCGWPVGAAEDGAGTRRGLAGETHVHAYL